MYQSVKNLFLESAIIETEARPAALEWLDKRACIDEKAIEKASTYLIASE
jgi:hypothetical protein